MTGGLIGTYALKARIFPGWRLAAGSVLFGISAVAITVAGLVALTYSDADLAVFVFIVLLSILPGAFIDWIFFKTPLTVVQWLGVMLFLFAGYSMLNYPSLRELIAPPPWILIALIVPLGLSFNEGITRMIGMNKISNPFVNNFWIGLTTITLSALLIVLTGNVGVITAFKAKFLILSAAMGFMVLVMISLKLLAYKSGGTIAFKKTITQGVQLTGAAILGALFLGDVITIGKVIGVAGFFIAIFLMEKESWSRSYSDR